MEKSAITKSILVARDASRHAVAKPVDVSSDARRVNAEIGQPVVAER